MLLTIKGVAIAAGCDAGPGTGDEGTLAGAAETLEVGGRAVGGLGAPVEAGYGAGRELRDEVGERGRVLGGRDGGEEREGDGLVLHRVGLFRVYLLVLIIWWFQYWLGEVWLLLSLSSFPLSYLVFLCRAIYRAMVSR